MVPFFFSDLFKYRLIDSRLINSTFLHNKEGCLLDFSDENNAYMIYFVSFLGTLAVLPGNIVSALLMDKIGRLRMLGERQSFRNVGFFSVVRWMLANFLLSCSRLQRDLLRQLFLPVLWEQRVGHDRAALSVWRN